jgi:hypothetical protein
VFSIGDLLGYVGFVLFCVGIVYWGIVVAKYLITKIYSKYELGDKKYDDKAF